jgi:hypothetical protein
MQMIKEKLKGHKPVIAAAPERGNVINLMDALKASLGQAKPPAKSKSKAQEGGEPAAKPTLKGRPRRTAVRQEGARAPGKGKAERRQSTGRETGHHLRHLGGAGCLSAPARGAAEVARQGGGSRGITRAQPPMSSSAVPCSTRAPEAIEAARIAAARRRAGLLSENGFRRCSAC